MGRPPRIDRIAVLDAALALADEAGLGAVTMQAVAAELDVTPMALYRHIANKADLLDGMVERVLTEFPPPPEGLTWSERLSTMAHSIRRSAHRHPGVFPLLLQRPAATSQSLQIRDDVYRAYEEAGIPSDRVHQTERLVSSALLGFVVSEVAGRFQNHSPQVLDGDFERLLQLLARFIE